jgi:large subunit ribosomal protein L15
MRGEGFTPPNQVEYNEVNLDQLAELPANTEVTPDSWPVSHAAQAQRTRLYSGPRRITVPLTSPRSARDQERREKIEAAGGSIEIIA